MSSDIFAPDGIKFPPPPGPGDIVKRYPVNSTLASLKGLPEFDGFLKMVQETGPDKYFVKNIEVIEASGYGKRMNITMVVQSPLGRMIIEIKDMWLAEPDSGFFPVSTKPVSVKEEPESFIAELKKL